MPNKSRTVEAFLLRSRSRWNNWLAANLERFAEFLQRRVDRLDHATDRIEHRLFQLEARSQWTTTATAPSFAKSRALSADRETT